ncbi:MAG: transcription-repair coupling factor [Bacteroidia bacterium]|nr:transcription-repair coupling factor [Bacteroidia bacterium]MDW8332869.1 transcription-repair coupling factor [Bacteroidia bacterium]
MHLKGLVREYAARVGPLMENGQTWVKGTHGSQRAFIAAALFEKRGKAMLAVLPERDEAAGFCSDLELMLADKHVVYFPACGKRPYEIEAVDNANVLKRAETLNHILRTPSDDLVVVTYAEALFEKVINRRAYSGAMLKLEVGDRPGMEVVIDALDEYGFVKQEYVYEPGQYAVRGAIIDVFSYSYDLPYRLQFHADTIESIRVFDPVSQLSTKYTSEIVLAPNVRTYKIDEERIPIWEYFPADTLVVSVDFEYTLAEIQKLDVKARSAYENLVAGTAGQTRRSHPDELYLSEKQLTDGLARFDMIEFGSKAFFSRAVCEWPAVPQPTFKKNFELLAENLASFQEQGGRNLIFCENEHQQRRLNEILTQIGKGVEFQTHSCSLYRGFTDKLLKINVLTDHQIFDRRHRFSPRSAPKPKDPTVALRELTQLRPGDYVTHVHHGIGRFAGLETVKIGDKAQEALKIYFSGDDVIYVGVNALHKIAKYTGRNDEAPKLSKLGSQEWSKTKARIKKRIKELAFDLVELYAKRKASKGYAFSPDTYLQQELEASFVYEDTPDQIKATQEVKRDMEADCPMDRLICGDVGFGKTEIAVRAAFKAACDGKQVAVLTPTTVLAMQHFQTFSERYKGFPVNVEFINRFKSAKEQKDVLRRLKEGKIDVVIGTHRLLSKDVEFKDLGLLIIDEEHKFGVAAKEKLRLAKVGVDTLTLSATPIPRTLQFSLLGIRDMSVIATPPPNRRPVETVVATFSPELIRDAIAYEIQRGGQAFFVHNRIQGLPEIAGMIQKLVPDARICIAHGQMDGEQIEKNMTAFVAHEYDVLVCTTLIESGLDIPNANTIIINDAHHYGLSDLHQMRGRVGRSNRKAFCYLLAPPPVARTSEANKRLQAIEEFSDLGGGFQIAMRDLDIRGAGDILGKEQSGFIAEIGYDMYQKLLEEAVRELKRERWDEQPTQDENDLERDCQVDLDAELRIPPEYIPNVADRLGYYQRLSQCVEEKDLRAVLRELVDRFGVLPPQVSALADAVRIRELGKKCRFQKIVLKNDNLTAVFSPEPQDPFYASEEFRSLLGYLQTQKRRLHLKQSGKSLWLVAKDVKTVFDAWMILQEIDRSMDLQTQAQEVV